MLAPPLNPVLEAVQKNLLVALEERKQALRAAGYLTRRFGVELDPERQVLPTSGARETIFHLPLAFAGGTRRKVVMPDPGTAFGAGQGYVRMALVPTLDECDAAIAAWSRAARDA